MEAAGLVLGVVATWRTCVQVFDIVGHSRSYGSDYELCRVKLEVERVRLLTWGDAMGLSNSEGVRSHPDSRLNQQDVQRIALNVLGGMQRIFENTDQLRERYGLIEELQRPALESAPSSLSARILRARANLTRDARDRQRAASIGQKTTWVVHDRSRFLQMVGEVGQFNDSLRDLFPHLSLREALRREFGRRSDVGPSSLLQQASVDDDPEISDVASQRLDELGATSSRRSTYSQASNAAPSDSPSSEGSRETATAVTPDEANEVAQDSPAHPQAENVAEPKEAASTDSNKARLQQMEERMEKFTSKLEHGELKVSIHGPTHYLAKASAFVSWIGLERSFWSNRDRGFVKSQHGSFEAYRKKNYLKKARKDEYAAANEEDVLFDPEASPWYEHCNPGTVSVEGFALECWEYEDIFGSRKDDMVFVSGPKVGVPAESLLRRLDELHRSNRKFGWNTAGDKLDLQEFVDVNYLNWDRAASDEITALYQALNGDGPIDFVEGQLVSVAWYDQKSICNFLWQLVLGKELAYRMEHYPDAWIRGYTCKVLSTVILSGLWTQNVSLVRNPARVPASLNKTPASPEERAKAERFKDEGNSALKEKEYQKAADLYTKALEIGGSNAIYICNRSAAYFSLDQHQQALYDAYMSKELDPTYAKAWARLGAAQFKLGSLDPAVEAYETAIRLAGDSVTETMKTGLEAAKTRVREFNAA